MPTSSRIIVFDLGGVVVRICRSWQEATGVAGLPFHGDIMSPELLTHRKTLVKQYEVASISDEEFFEAVSRSMNGLYEPHHVQCVHDLWITGEYPGVATLIDDLHALGLDTGVLSNTNAWHWRQMTSGPHGEAKFPTPQKVRHLHASHLLGLVKPEEAIFRAFESRSGYAPSQIIYFDDLAENVAAAQAAGWDALQIDHAGDTAAQMRLHLRLRDIGV